MDVRSNSVQNEAEGTRNVDGIKILSMRAIIEEEDPRSEVADDATLKRFLYARELNVQKACEMYLKYRKWRQKFVPLGYVSEAEISNELKKNLLCMQGFDKKGRPIAVVIFQRHKPCHRTLEDVKRFFVYCFDKMSASASRGDGRFTIIADLAGWTYKHVDIRGYLAVLEILQEYYPERLGQVYIIHLPYIFWAVWNIVYPFIDKRTRQKVLMIEDKNIKSILLNDIDESQLPEIYGGKLPLVPVEDVIVPN